MRNNGVDLNGLQRVLKLDGSQTAADLREDDEIEAVQLVQQVVDGLGRAQGAVHTRQRQCGRATGGGESVGIVCSWNGAAFLPLFGMAGRTFPQALVSPLRRVSQCQVLLETVSDTVGGHVRVRQLLVTG